MNGRLNLAAIVIACGIKFLTVRAQGHTDGARVRGIGAERNDLRGVCADDRDGGCRVESAADVDAAAILTRYNSAGQRITEVDATLHWCGGCDDGNHHTLSGGGSGTIGDSEGNRVRTSRLGGTDLRSRPTSSHRRRVCVCAGSEVIVDHTTTGRGELTRTRRRHPRIRHRRRITIRIDKPKTTGHNTGHRIRHRSSHRHVRCSVRRHDRDHRTLRGGRSGAVDDREHHCVPTRTIRGIGLRCRMPSGRRRSVNVGTRDEVVIDDTTTGRGELTRTRRRHPRIRHRRRITIKIDKTKSTGHSPRRRIRDLRGGHCQVRGPVGRHNRDHHALRGGRSGAVDDRERHRVPTRTIRGIGLRSSMPRSRRRSVNVGTRDEVVINHTTTGRGELTRTRRRHPRIRHRRRITIRIHKPKTTPHSSRRRIRHHRGDHGHIRCGVGRDGIGAGMRCDRARSVGRSGDIGGVNDTSRLIRIRGVDRDFTRIGIRGRDTQRIARLQYLHPHRRPARGGRRNDHSYFSVASIGVQQSICVDRRYAFTEPRDSGWRRGSGHRPTIRAGIVIHVSRCGTLDSARNEY